MFTTLRTLIKETWSDLRAARPGIRAGRLYGRALNLQKKGRNEEAFRLLDEAIACLPDAIEPDNVGSAATVSSFLVMTVSYAELASTLGTPHAAEDAIRRTIAVVGPHAHDAPAEIQQYLNWLQSRLARDDP
jgi:hypothetical protein